MYKVLIADDEPKIRKKLAGIIDWKCFGLEIACEAEDGEIALQLAGELRPDIYILDINMPFINGLELIERIKETQPNAVIIIISGHDEFGYAQQALKVRACELAKQAGADFVKTSTGFGSGGATVEDVRLMKRTVGDSMLVKASTGINDRAVCDQMIAAGAVRMGTSKGILIVKGEGGSSPCVKCGACTKQCPSGNVKITKNEY
jgi:CheY-like chemotaxis protein